MKYYSTTTELDGAALNGASNTTGRSSRRGYFHRISQAIELGILAFVILLTMLGTYVHHNRLLSDVLIS